MPTLRCPRLLVLLGALGVLACEDTCPEGPVPEDILDYACGPTARGDIPLVNASFEAAADPLAGWTLADAAGARLEVRPGLDGCVAVALTPASERFGAPARLAQTIPAAALRGQRVRLGACVRGERASDARRPALAVRALVGERQRVVDSATVPVHSDAWALRGVEFDVPADADQLELSIALGEASRVELDGVTLDQLGPACPGCEPPAPLDAVELDNLTAFTTLLGHVRLFYPGDEAAGADWNAIALAGVQAVLRADSPAALADALERVFQPRAPLLRVGVGAPDLAPIARPADATRALVWHHGPRASERADRAWLLEHVPSDTPVPDPGERHAIALGRGLVASMPYAVWAAASTRPPPRRSDVPLAKPAGFVPDLGDRITRLAAIALLAAEMTHRSPRVARHRAIWGEVLRDSFARAAVAPDRFGLREVVWRMFAAVDDVPAQVHVGDDVRLGHRLGLAWAWLEGQVVVTAVDPARAPDLRVGDIVEAVDGVPIAADLAAVGEYAPGLTPERRMVWALAVHARGLTRAPRELRVRRADGSTAAVAVATMPVAFARQLAAGPAIRDVAPGVLYLDLGQLDVDALRGAADRLVAADAAILDLRLGVDDRIVALLGEPGELVARNLIWPEEQHAWLGAPVSVRRPAPPPLALPRRLVVLADARAVQGSERLVEFLRARHGARFVGSPTAGGPYEPREFKLPGGLVVGFTDSLPGYAGGRDPLVPIEPDVPVTRTIAGVRAGRDEVLERALAELERSPGAVETR